MNSNLLVVTVIAAVNGTAFAVYAFVHNNPVGIAGLLLALISTIVGAVGATSYDLEGK